MVCVLKMYLLCYANVRLTNPVNQLSQMIGLQPRCRDDTGKPAKPDALVEGALLGNYIELDVD